MVNPNFEQDPPLILIVDDERTIRLVLRRAMEKEGYRVAEATDGKHCLEACQQLQPDLVLLDAIMPELDGFDCCAQLSKDLGDQRPSVLMITALNDKTSVDRAFAVGAADYITKPIDWPVLCQRVRRLLQTRWATKELQRQIRAQEDLALQMARRSKELEVANTALQTEIAERQQAEAQITASLKEKEVLLKEIHHRVKNNLQIISSLLKLQSRAIKDQHILSIFNESQSRIRTMALIHENLYQSSDLSRINFAEYIHKLAANLFRSYDTSSSLIEAVVNVADIFLEIDVAVPCGLMINELVSNSLKYAFPHQTSGRIQIDMYAKGDQSYQLIVSDNGIGLPTDLDIENTNTLGLQLVVSLVEQLEGQLKIKRQPGTKFEITFTVKF